MENQLLIFRFLHPCGCVGNVGLGMFVSSVSKPPSPSLNLDDFHHAEPYKIAHSMFVYLLCLKQTSGKLGLYLISRLKSRSLRSDNVKYKM